MEDGETGRKHSTFRGNDKEDFVDHVDRFQKQTPLPDELVYVLLMLEIVKAISWVKYEAWVYIDDTLDIDQAREKILAAAQNENISKLQLPKHQLHIKKYVKREIKQTAGAENHRIGDALYFCQAEDSTLVSCSIGLFATCPGSQGEPDSNYIITTGHGTSLNNEYFVRTDVGLKTIGKCTHMLNEDKVDMAFIKLREEVAEASTKLWNEVNIKSVGQEVRFSEDLWDTEVYRNIFSLYRSVIEYFNLIRRHKEWQRTSVETISNKIQKLAGIIGHDMTFSSLNFSRLVERTDRMTNDDLVTIQRKIETFLMTGPDHICGKKGLQLRPRGSREGIIGMEIDKDCLWPMRFYLRGLPGMSDQDVSEGGDSGSLVCVYDYPNTRIPVSRDEVQAVAQSHGLSQLPQTTRIIMKKTTNTLDDKCMDSRTVSDSGSKSERDKPICQPSDLPEDQEHNQLNSPCVYDSAPDTHIPVTQEETQAVVAQSPGLSQVPQTTQMIKNKTTNIQVNCMDSRTVSDSGYKSEERLSQTSDLSEDKEHNPLNFPSSFDPPRPSACILRAVGIVLGHAVLQEASANSMHGSFGNLLPYARCVAREKYKLNLQTLRS